MISRGQWIDEGLLVLREQGNSGIRIDRIAERLELTKGSFHHHFAGIGDYRQALLTRYEQNSLAAIKEAVSALADLPAQQALMRLPDYVAFDPRLDAAIRSWSFDDVTARAVQERIDSARLDALLALWRGVVSDPTQARIAALIPHLLMIGGSAALPTPTQVDMRAMFDLLASLVPSVE